MSVRSSCWKFNFLWMIEKMLFIVLLTVIVFPWYQLREFVSGFSCRIFFGRNCGAVRSLKMFGRRLWGCCFVNFDLFFTCSDIFRVGEVLRWNLKCNYRIVVVAVYQKYEIFHVSRRFLKKYLLCLTFWARSRQFQEKHFE